MLLIPFAVSAQDPVLVPEEAIRLTLSNNYGLRIAANTAEQASNNNTAGNAGMLPDVNLNGAYLRSDNNLEQRFVNGLEVNRANVGGTNANAQAGLSWTIFDGMRMFYAKDRLEQLSAQAQNQLRQQIENTIEQVISSYYTIVRLRQVLKATREQIALSQERVKIAERKLNNGSGSRLDLLQALTELNRQRSAEIAIASDAEEARIALNRLMGRDALTPFATADTVVITYRPTLDQLKTSVPAQNALLSSFRINNRISALTMKENQALRYPRIAFNTQYNFIRTTNEAGFALYNQQHGLQYGLSASIPIFNGFNLSRQIKNARLDMLSAQLQLENAEQEINAQLLNAWREFSSSLTLLSIEEENIKFAGEVLLIAQERYRVGSSASVELQEAQRTYEEALTRLTDARFAAKISETTLRRLNGELVR